MKILDVPQSGSIAGQTSSRNRFGQYRRTRAVPVNPNTLAQQNARGVLSGLSATWKTISEAAKDAWTAWAAEHPVLDSLGQSVVLTGHQAYIKINSALTQAGLDNITTVPTSAGIDTPSATVVVGTAAALSVTIDQEFDPSTLVVETSPPRSKGVTFNADYRITTVNLAPALDDPILSAASLTARWGLLAAGQRFFVRMWAITPTGERSPYGNLVITLT